MSAERSFSLSPWHVSPWQVLSVDTTQIIQMDCIMAQCAAELKNVQLVTAAVEDLIVTNSLVTFLLTSVCLGSQLPEGPCICRGN